MDKLLKVEVLKAPYLGGLTTGSVEAGDETKSLVCAS